MRPIAISLILALAVGAFANKDDQVIFGRPLGGFPIDYEAYSCGYKAKYRCSAWVSYKLTRENLTKRRLYKDAGLFKDPVVVEKGIASAVPGDFSEYGFAFLCPQDDAVGKGGGEVEKDVFSLANLVLMKDSSPAASVWASLQKTVRAWANAYGTVWVIAGPIFAFEPERIGASKVSVPKGYYKIVIRKEGEGIRTVAFSIPVEGSGKLDSFLVPIRAIEADTEVDFLSDLPDEVETAVETDKPAMWPVEALPDDGPVKPGDQGTTAPPRQGTTGGGDDGGGTPAAVSGARAGKVWALPRDGVYFLPGSKHYGNGDGTYMSESDAAGLGFKRRGQ